ncbi:MAG: glycosyltransferase family 4 protein [Halobacteriota archaeon]|uniref:glycosyltransferase family 4 protein n=1 Tax=Natronomonas sp. TaxID=2184060 RepID=UPI003974CCDC
MSSERPDSDQVETDAPVLSHYLEFEAYVTGGIRESVAHQRKILDELGVRYTTGPSIEVDVFHCNLVGPRSLWHATRARSNGIPVIAHTHVTAEDFGDSFRFTNALSKPLKPYLEWAYGQADLLVCPSEYNRRLIETYTDTPTTVISNGVDLEKLDGFESLADEYRQRYGLEPPVVFLVGHVLKRKGLETFVELARRLPELDFAWFGPLDLRMKGRDTTRLIRESPDNCTFTGYVDDIRGAYAAGDIFCFPTHEENEGIALLEAMAAGKAMIVRDIEPFSWLEDGEECLKVDAPPGEIDPFVDAVRRLGDPELRRRLGSNAAGRSESLSLTSIADRYRTLYAEVS